MNDDILNDPKKELEPVPAPAPEHVPHQEMKSDLDPKLQLEFLCPRCHYTTAHKGHFVRHINNKRPCQSYFADVSLVALQRDFASENLKSYNCEHCCKQFKTRSGLAYHRPICKDLFDGSDGSQGHSSQQIDDLREEVKKLKTIVDNIHARPQIVNNGEIQTLDNSHHQHIHFHVNTFGNESKDHISKEFAIECFRKGAYGILDMINKIYFDESAPENHNIKLRSLKNMLVEVFKDPHWEVRGFNDTVNGMITTSRHEIIKDINQQEVLNDDELLYTLQNLINIPSHRVKNIKEHAKAKLVQRREIDK